MKTIIGFAGLVLALTVIQARAEIHVQAGGGLHVPTGDSARYAEKGYRLGAGVEWKVGQMGLLLEGAYNRDKVNSEESEKTFRESHPAFPAAAPLQIDGVAQVYELNLSPKFYLLDTENIGAFLIAGGGPRWIKKRVNIDLPPPQIDQHLKASETSLGLQIGFGVEAAIPGSLRLGLSPTYHFVFADHRVQYAALTAYLKW
jgi:opacity protein-like surface antigen